MPRQLKKLKPYIVVFFEGESEEAYAEFLREKYKNVAVIKPVKGLFEEAKAKFDKAPKYRDNVEVTDEIWFFFDVETKDITKWDDRYKIIKYLRKRRKKPNIIIRLLMTTGCIEYWLMLHFKMLAPPLQTTAAKNKMISDLKKIVPTYQKGDEQSMKKITVNYLNAVKHGEQTVKNLLPAGLPCIVDTDVRNEWLYKKCLTFSNVHEAINFLESL